MHKTNSYQSTFVDAEEGKLIKCQQFACLSAKTVFVSLFSPFSPQKPFLFNYITNQTRTNIAGGGAWGWEGGGVEICQTNFTYT